MSSSSDLSETLQHPPAECASLYMRQKPVSCTQSSRRVREDGCLDNLGADCKRCLIRQIYARQTKNPSERPSDKSEPGNERDVVDRKEQLQSFVETLIR